MEKLKQTNFFIDKEVTFNDEKRKIVIAAEVTSPIVVNVGVAIFNPKDEYSQELGQKIALGRARKENDKTITFITSHPFTSKKQILSLMENALINIQDNIKEFAPFAIKRKKKVQAQEVKNEVEQTAMHHPV